MKTVDTVENNVYRTSIFDNDYKRFVKKFDSLVNEIRQLEIDLTAKPDMGIPLGSNLYKIRLACKSKGKGKSGAFRIITYLVDERIDGTDVYLITMYDKSEEKSINTSQLKKIISKVFSII